jgi:GNAT superfamily N-acetyltransferase
LHKRIAQFLFAQHDAAVHCTIASTVSLPASNAAAALRHLHIVRVNISESPPLPAGDGPSFLSWQRDMFSRCIPYVARAFGETLEDMTPESREEHFRHLTGGEQLFEAVLEEGDDLRAVGHALFASYLVKLDGEFAIEANAVHCHGMCVDPQIHGAGVGGRLLSTAIKTYLECPTSQKRLLYFTARTQNDAILKIFYHSATSVLPPAVTLGSEATGLLEGPARVFPAFLDDNGSDGTNELLRRVAAAQRDNTSPSDPYDAVTGVFPGCYPPHLRSVFGGDPSFAKSSGVPLHASLRSHMKTSENGDAAMLVVRVR